MSAASANQTSAVMRPHPGKEFLDDSTVEHTSKDRNSKPTLELCHRAGGSESGEQSDAAEQASNAAGQTLRPECGSNRTASHWVSQWGQSSLSLCRAA